MTIVDELTPVYYELLRIGIQRDPDAGVIAIADLNIRNAACRVIATDNPCAPVPRRAGQRGQYAHGVDPGGQPARAGTGGAGHLWHGLPVYPGD